MKWIEDSDMIKKKQNEIDIVFPLKTVTDD